MTVRVRFAPSPTGYLHIGGLRTAIYNYLFAKKHGGELILRVEDTDQERSKKEYEALQISDLKWAGLDWAEGPDKGGDYGPYRQSERYHIYTEFADKLIDEGKAYYCFASEQEIEEMKQKAMKENRPPHYDGRYRNFPKDEALQRIASGEKPVVRFKAPLKSYVLNDDVRGRVVFPENMVGDFVIMRSNGLPVYNFCCVVDDMLMKITHVIRGEDHLSNTVRQLMVYEALEAPLPHFAHVSLLIGEDRQKLSKRHGATSVNQYREQNYLPDALCNYLCLLGWSHPDEKDVFKLNEIENVFDSNRFTKAAAIYDIEKLKYINGQHIKLMSSEEILEKVTGLLPKDHLFHQQSDSWKKATVELFKDQLHFFSEFPEKLVEIFSQDISLDDELKDVLSWESTGTIIQYLEAELLKLDGDFAKLEDFENWSAHIKKDLKIKGKQLFKGIRAALTGRGHGPELKFIIPLTPKAVIQNRMEKLKAL